MKKHNRRYKDSVFVDLFSTDKTAKANFLSLYNALHGTDYQSTAILKNIRLKQVLYMSFANDVSYLVDNKIIVLAEHPRSRMYIRVPAWATSFCPAKTSLLHGTSGIRAASATLRINLCAARSSCTLSVSLLK